MKQIYEFDAARPPLVTEAFLRKKLETRRLQKQERLLQAAAGFMFLAFVLLGFMLSTESLVLGICSIVGACLWFFSGSFLTLALRQNWIRIGQRQN